jgi:integrase
MRECGIRECEVCLIRVGNIVWDNGLYGEFWMDEHLVSWKGHGWTIWPGLKSSRKKKKKHERDGRWVQMTPRALEIAKKHVAGKTKEAFLFINPMTGNHYAPDALYRAFKNHSGAEGISPHPAWVHSYVTDVMESGTTVEDAVILTGKSATTLERYDNPRRRRQRDIMSRFLGKKVVSINKAHGSEMEVKKKGGSQ